MIELIHQNDHELSELRKRFMSIYDNNQKLSLAEEIEKLNKSKRENLEIKAKMMGAANVKSTVNWVFYDIN